MNDFDKNMKDALEGANGFDPARAGSAQQQIYETYERKMKESERAMWLQLYLLTAAGAYAVGGFMVQATTTRGWVGYGLVVMLAFVIIIQKTILHGISATQIVALKEIKQLRLAVVGGGALPDEAAAKPLRGLRQWERSAWLFGLLVISIGAALLGTQSNRQDDLWRLMAEDRIEARSVLTLRRFPHKIPSFYGITGPVEGAVLQSATFNGKPVPFESYSDKNTPRNQYTVRFPSRLSWMRDRIELVWAFPLSALEQQGTYRAPLRCLMPVHGYALSLYVQDDSRFMVPEDAWRFNKRPKELKNEAEARRTVKLFTVDGSDVPREDFGSCGLPIIPRPAR